MRRNTQHSRGWNWRWTGIARTFERWLSNRFDEDRYEPKIRLGDFFECCVRKVNNAAVLNEAAGRASVRDGHQNTARFVIWRVKGYAHACAERIKPGGGGHFIRIKSVSVGHQPAPVLLAVP